MAKRSYLASEVRSGGREEPPRVRGQGQHPRPGLAAWRSKPTLEARGNSQEKQPHIQGVLAVLVQEGLEELLHFQGQEGWL